jgi:hypothetical protein
MTSRSNLQADAFYGQVQHVDPENFDAASFADLWFMASFDLRMFGLDDGRNAGVVYGSDLLDGAWYPSISLMVVDELATFSLEPEDALSLADEFRRRMTTPPVSNDASAVAFYGFFAEMLRVQVQEAAAKNARGDMPKPVNEPANEAGNESTSFVLRSRPFGKLERPCYGWSNKGKLLNLLLITCAGTASSGMFLKMDGVHHHVLQVIMPFGFAPLTFFG